MTTDITTEVEKLMFYANDYHLKVEKFKTMRPAPMAWLKDMNDAAAKMMGQIKVLEGYGLKIRWQIDGKQQSML
jgi:hypothetical protein